MSILSKWRVGRARDRLLEEEMYQMVNAEMEQGIIRDGLWTKAIAICEGDDKKAKATYITLRVQSLRDEAELATAVSKMIDDDSQREAHDDIKLGAKQPSDSKHCERCGAKISINYGSAYHTLCAKCA